jgi:hypothetical protein
MAVVASNALPRLLKPRAGRGDTRLAERGSGFEIFVELTSPLEILEVFFVLLPAK